MNARFIYLKQSLAGLLFTHEAPRDELHEHREVLPEPRPLLAEERGLGDAAGVNGRESDARGAMILLVQQIGGHHDAHLRVLVRLMTTTTERTVNSVCWAGEPRRSSSDVAIKGEESAYLGSVEAISVDHLHGPPRSILEALQIPEVGDGVDPSPADRVVVAGDRPDHDHSRLARLPQIVNQQRRQQEMTQMVDLQLLLDIVFGVLGGVERRLVDGGIAHQAIQGLAGFELSQLRYKLLDRSKGGKITLHCRERGHVEFFLLGDQFHFIQITNCTNDMPLARSKQGLGCLFTKTGRCTGNHGNSFVSELLSAHNVLLHLLKVRQLDLLKKKKIK